MGAVQCFRLVEGETLPDLVDYSPFKAIVVSDVPCSPEWRDEVSVWLVAQGCLYMMAWGHECSSWDDAVDRANIEAHQCDIPNDKFVMTTWHEDESLADVFRFAKFAAEHPDVQLDQTVIVHVSGADRGNDLLAIYENLGSDSQTVSASR